MGFLPGGSEWLIILLVVIILFGAKKIPELMRGLGSGIREFKNAANTNDEKDKNDAPKSE
ncbi:MAG: twin-arginine translocase TatA/TatE family subunit [Candidatus Kapaibacteriota bacterium]|jgi:sec-independent protein translocase protein TatA